MNNVRSASRRTLALAICVVICLLIYRFLASKGVVSYINYNILSTKYWTGRIHYIVINISFNLFILATILRIIYDNGTLLESVKPVLLPIFFMTLVLLTTAIRNFYVFIFWIVYSILLILFMRRSFRKLSEFSCAGSENVSMFLKTLGHRGPGDSVLDTIVLRVCKTLLLIGIVVLFFSTIYFIYIRRYDLGYNIHLSRIL